MKKLILKTTAACMLFLISGKAIAQNSPAFDVGDNTIGIAIGVGGYGHSKVHGYGYSYTNVNLPSFMLIYDHGTFGEVGPGTIGLGAIIGYQYSFIRNYGDYDANWSNLLIGARGTWHLTILKDKNNHFDPYGGVMVGMRFRSYNDTYADKYDIGYESSEVLPTGSVFVGAKYNFTKAFGAFAEVGFDISNFRIGLNFNF